MKNIKNIFVWTLDLVVLTIYFITALICGIVLTILCRFVPTSINARFAKFVKAFDKIGNDIREAVWNLYED